MKFTFWSASSTDRETMFSNNTRTLVLKMLVMTVALVHRAAGEHSPHYSRQWAVHIEGGVGVANAIARKHGFINLGEIFPDWYHFEHHKVVKRSLSPSVDHHENLMNESQVIWARQQIMKSRQKRDLLPFRQKSYRVNLNDPRWPQMWYLNRGQAPDMNVQPAWMEGITGVGVVVTILDDGLEKDHPDLFRNYDPQASYDVNNHDEDPMPRYDLIDSNRHGTRCAGEVAATANNSLCAVGVAFGASVGGVRMLDGDVTDAVEARSLSLNPQHIDIYSASWGPDDDGKTVDGPGELATRAFIEGVTKGRSGKGSIFVWASGNGGRDHDNCNCDGYTNSIWTLSISSATENGYVPWYSEACSSTLATTYSSGATGEKQVVTTDLHHQCTSSHTGTSASAPLAAGICALALESNRELTWRDMQHIVVRTARPANLKSPDWKVNGVGRNVSHSFGYGLMDAYAMVKLARSWKTVPEQHKCEVSAPHTDKLIPAKSHVSLQLHVKECAGVNFLEHVQAKVSLVSSRRGDLQIHLTSPAGTRSTLLARRPHDVSRAGFQSWPFMSVHTWGEKPFGIWQLEIHNEGRFLGRATLQEWALIFYGTAVTPDGHEGHNPPLPSLRVTNSASSLPSKPILKPVNKPVRPPTVHSTPFTASKKLKPNQKNSTKIGKLTPPRTLITTTTPSHVHILKVLQPTSPSNIKNRLKSTTTAPGRTSKRPSSKAITPLPTLFPHILTNVSLSTDPPILTTLPSTSTIRHTTTAITTKSTTTAITSTTSDSELTILLETPSHIPPKMSPDIFKQYPKIQKVYPVYALSKSRVDPSSFHPSANLVPNLDLLQEETQHLQVEGTLSGWKMVFYGTETSPGGEHEDDEDLKITENKALENAAGIISSNEDDPQHNAVEPVTGGQWKDVHKVESPDLTHNEVLRTTTENDVSSSSAGCLALSKKGQHCIECVKGMFLYEGRCEAACPEKHFSTLNEESQAICSYCHYTCNACSGPNDYECISCYGDALLKHMSKSESYCYPKALLPVMETSKWFYWMFIAFAANVTAFVLILVYFVFYKLIKNSYCYKTDHHYSKMKNDANELDTKSVLYNSSDSENDL